MRSCQSDTLFGVRGFEYVPTLRRERQSCGRAQARVIVGDENGRRIVRSSGATRAKSYVLGLVPAMQSPLLALLNGWSSGLLVDPLSEESRFGCTAAVWQTVCLGW
jgi:hypothetical protein